MEAAASLAGCRNLSDYLRHLHNSKPAAADSPPPATPIAPRPKSEKAKLAFKTGSGAAYCGDSAAFMATQAEPASVDLVMTSPPFGLVRKKSYGNEDADAYCDWFRPFAEGFRRVLKPQGSLVIDIGGAWKPGTPTRSLYHFDLLLMLCREYGFHLCLEHFWWNPSKLPTPAEWVNVRRVRVKDAVNCVWWLSPTPWPKASNRRILSAYSDSMKSLLKNGYNPKLRPSGHDISPHFARDNGGAVPPNLLAIANTESNSRYQAYCHEHGLPVHPARFPSLLPEYFIRMLTDRGDLVLDPFAGSCVTGAVAESLGRRWVGVELLPDYVKGAAGRFAESPTVPSKTCKQTTYEISTPCGLAIEGPEAPLATDGGKSRPPGQVKRKTAS
jgi:site-specific DNA-methyltransferase (cytosine-N4-specific)